MPTATIHQKRLPGRRPKTSHVAADTRSQILAAALSVFARRGYDGASVRDVAQKAKVNNAMIYYHFQDKMELYRAVLSESISAFDRIWEHAIFRSDASAREKVRKYVEELVRFQHTHEDLRRLLSIEFASCSRNYRWLGENLFKTGYENLSAIIAEGVRRGELRKIDRSLAIASLVGIVVQTFIMKPIAEYASGKKMQLPIRQFGAFVTDMFFDGVGGSSQMKRSRCRTEG